MEEEIRCQHCGEKYYVKNGDICPFCLGINNEEYEK